MTNLHIAEVGENFQDIDGFNFLSNQNLLEYDFILIDTGVLIEEIDGQAKSYVESRVKHLQEFIKIKNIPVVFIMSRSAFIHFGIIGGPSSLFSLLELDVEEAAIRGRKMERFSEIDFATFLKENAEQFEYITGFSQHPGISIAFAKSQSISIGFYTRDYIFLPTFYEDSDLDGDIYLKEVYSFAQAVRKSDDVILLPKWTDRYLLPDEKQKRHNLIEIEKSIAKLQRRKRTTEQKLQKVISLKQLWTSTGFALESIVKDVFVELGFAMLKTESNRDDLIMQWNDVIVVGEIKGLGKSAGEKNAAQLEKWVSSYYADHGIKPKGLLICNTFREIALNKRIEPSFPDQMLNYTKQRGHCLMTTIQLCGVLLYCRQRTKEKEEIIDSILNTEGRFEGFSDWTNFIETAEDEVDLS